LYILRHFFNGLITAAMLSSSSYSFFILPFVSLFLKFLMSFSIVSSYIMFFVISSFSFYLNLLNSSGICERADLGKIDFCLLGLNSLVRGSFS
jgi:hypothetical protein